MNQKSFIKIILVVVIIVLLCAVGYFTLVKKSLPIAQQISTPTQTLTKTPTPVPTTTPMSTPKDETKNWKIYTNNKYGFRFKYPPSWRLGGPPLGESSQFNDDLIQFRGENEKCVVTFGPSGGQGLGPNWRVEDKSLTIDNRNFIARYIYFNNNLRQIVVYSFPTTNSANSLEVSSIVDQDLSNQCLETFISILRTVDIN
jgi:hypothetical protein